MILSLILSAAWAACTVIGGATVHTPSGPMEGASVILDGERVVGVGVGLPGLKLSLGRDRQVEGATWEGQPCTFVQGAGHHVTPGVIAVDGSIGLVEVGLEEAANSSDPRTDDAVKAALSTADAYDPRSTVVGVNRVGGVTHAVVMPGGGGLVRGQAALVRLSGASQAETVVDRTVAFRGSIPSGSWAEGLRQLRELVADVQLVARDPAAYRSARVRAMHPDASPLDLEALIPMVRGEVPLVVEANKASDIEALLRTADELGLRLVLIGAAEGWLVADRLAEADVPVVVQSMTRRANGFDRRWGDRTNAAKLIEAGVDVMFVASMTTHNAHLARHHAGNAVREGADPTKAAAALWEVPARVFGLEGHGRLEAGAAADVVLWDGDPLEVGTLARQVWIDGRAIPMESRQTLLRDRYLERLGLAGD